MNRENVKGNGKAPTGKAKKIKKDGMHGKQKSNYKGKRNDKTGAYSKNTEVEGKFKDGFVREGEARVGKFQAQTAPFNDVAWYAKNPNMLRDAASLSFANALGDPIPGVFGHVGTRITTVPGVCALETALTLGQCNNSNSPANLAANNIYAYVRYMNSGAKNYDQADLMLYFLAMDSIYSAWNWMKRIYGECTVYSQKNRYLPTVTVAAEGVDWTDIQYNLADFRLMLNTFAAQISSFAVPATMPYFVRHSWMFSNIYKDSDSEKAQLYMFVPKYFYYYSETSSKYGGQLLPIEVANPNKKWTYGQLRSLLSYMIAQIAYSEDIGVMSGDVLKAYGNERLFKLSPVQPDYTVLPVYNEQVLNQIHNSNVVHLKDITAFVDPMDDLPGFTTNDTAKVYQDPTSGYLIWKPSAISAEWEGAWNQGYALYPERHIINMPWDNVSPEDVMEATRLVTSFKDTRSSGDGWYDTPLIDHCGSEIITGRNYYTLDRGLIDRQRIWWYAAVLPTSTTDTSISNALAITTQFDWHPLTIIMTKNPEVSVVSKPIDLIQTGIIGDMNNYTTITNDTLQKLHTVAIMSEFNVPQLGSF